jgi:hypothetical protein
MVTKYDEYELDSILHEVKEIGYAFINKYKLWRLLGKGSGAAGTWKALLDAWVELNAINRRNELQGFELGDIYFISTVKTTSLENWAGER